MVFVVTRTLRRHAHNINPIILPVFLTMLLSFSLPAHPPFAQTMRPSFHHQKSLSVILMPPVRQEPYAFKKICPTLIVIHSGDLKSVLPDASAPTLPRHVLQAPVGSAYNNEAISKAGLRDEVRSHPFRSPRSDSLEGKPILVNRKDCSTNGLCPPCHLSCLSLTCDHSSPQRLPQRRASFITHFPSRYGVPTPLPS